MGYETASNKIEELEQEKGTACPGLRFVAYALESAMCLNQPDYSVMVPHPLINLVTKERQVCAMGFRGSIFGV
jgi:hypothetical protein